MRETAIQPPADFTRGPGLALPSLLPCSHLAPSLGAQEGAESQGPQGTWLSPSRAFLQRVRGVQTPLAKARSGLPPPAWGHSRTPLGCAQAGRGQPLGREEAARGPALPLSPSGPTILAGALWGGRLGGWAWELSRVPPGEPTPPSHRNRAPASQTRLLSAPPPGPSTPSGSSAPTPEPGAPLPLRRFALQHVCWVLRSIAGRCCEIRSWRSYHTLPARLLPSPAQTLKREGRGHSWSVRPGTRREGSWGAGRRLRGLAVGT